MVATTIAISCAACSDGGCGGDHSGGAGDCNKDCCEFRLRIDTVAVWYLLQE